jgi:hypothetical protein
MHQEDEVCLSTKKKEDEVHKDNIPHEENNDDVSLTMMVMQGLMVW